MFKKLTEDQKKVLLIWFFLGLFIMGILLLFVNKHIQDKEKELVDEHYYILEDYSRYYIVNNAINKYYGAIKSENYSSAYKMLDKNYVNQNEITEDNIQTKIKTYDKNIAFQGSLMCRKRLGKGHASFYVSGDVVADLNEETLKTGDDYDGKILDVVFYEVLLDENTRTFSISKIDASTFRGECHE